MPAQAAFFFFFFFFWGGGGGGGVLGEEGGNALSPLFKQHGSLIFLSLFNSFPNKPWFLHVCSTRLLKTEGKGEIVGNEQFLLFPQCFLPI